MCEQCGIMAGHCAHTATHLYTVNIGQRNIKNHYVGLPKLEKAQRLLAAHSALRLKSLDFEDSDQAVDRIRIVVNDKDASLANGWMRIMRPLFVATVSCEA